MHLFTCRYQRFVPTMGLAIRTTVGYPRFMTYPLAGHARLISPTWTMIEVKDQAIYHELYKARLDQAGVDAIREELAVIAAEYDEPKLILLCYDDLSKPGGWCHRRMFADWWTTQTGEPVPELAEPPIESLF